MCDSVGQFFDDVTAPIVDPINDTWNATVDAFTGDTKDLGPDLGKASASVGEDTAAVLGPGALSEATGFGAAASDAVVGAGEGAVGSALSGGDPLTGSLTGGALGGIQGGVSDALSTTSTGSPSLATGSGVPAAGAPTGSFSAPTDVSGLENSDINTALNSQSLSGEPLSSNTDMGSIASTGPSASPDLGSSAGGDTSNIGPVNSVPSSTSIGNAGNANISGAGSAGGSNIGLPANASGNISGAALGAASSSPNLISNLESGNFGAAAGNVGNFLTNPKNIPLELGAGFTGYEALKGPAGLTSSEQALQTQGNSLNAQANEGLAAANSGTLTAPQQANVQQFITNQTNQLYQQLASQGVTNPQSDSRFIAGMAQIQQQAQTMVQNYIQQTFTNAMSEAGSAAQDLGSVAQAQSASDTAFTNSITSAISSIGGMYALSGGKQS